MILTIFTNFQRDIQVGWEFGDGFHLAVVCVFFRWIFQEYTWSLNIGGKTIFGRDKLLVVGFSGQIVW